MQNPRRTTFPPIRPFRILVVDDSPTNRMVIRRMLQRLGYEVLQADNGEQAIKQLCKESVDLVLMDCEMPRLDGWTATACIRAGACGESKRWIPIIALTAHTRWEERRKCSEVGMDDFLAKPVGMADLEHMLQKWLGVNWDVKAMMDRVDGDPELGREMVRSFLEETPGQIEQLVQALDAGDFEEARRLAHGLKGSASFLSIEGIRQAAFQVEQATKQKDPQTARAHLQHLQQEWNRVRPALEEYLGQGFQIA